MKTELRLAPHTVIEGAHVVEIWHEGQFIGQIAGAEGPGVRVISKYPLASSIQRDPVLGVVVTVADVRILC